MSRLLPTRLLPALLALLPGMASAQEPPGHAAHARHHPSTEPERHAAHAGHAPAQAPAAEDHAGHHRHASTAPSPSAPQPSSDAHGEHARAGHAEHAPAPGHDGHAGHAPAGQSAAAHAMHAHTHGPGMPAADASLPREPIPAVTDADRAAAFPSLRHGHAHDAGRNGLLRIDRLEAWDASGGSGQAWEAQAWIGGDVQRLWLRSEGERERSRTRAAELELLYGRGIAPWWDLLAGVRRDFAPGDGRTWAALGVQGLVPYKIEVAATAYLASGGHTALRAELGYELPLSRYLVLQPRLEVELRGRDDPLRGIGSGLSSAEAGLRLRWNLTPRLAPYLGLVHERAFGGTGRYQRAEHGGARDTRWVAGVRAWF